MKILWSGSIRKGNLIKVYVNDSKGQQIWNSGFVTMDQIDSIETRYKKTGLLSC